MEDVLLLRQKIVSLSDAEVASRSRYLEYLNEPEIIIKVHALVCKELRLKRSEITQAINNTTESAVV